MKVNKRAAYLFIFSCFAFFQPIQAQEAGLTTAQIQEYEEQAKQLVSFVEYSFNTIGDPATSARDKDVIINQSYLKAFDDENVQIEDDLVADRSVITNKNIQAYMKDIDFFFKNVKFTFNIIEVSHNIREDGQLYFNVTTSRHLQGITVDEKIVNSDQKRFFEINLDQSERDLKIASIYTTKISEREELTNWWRDLPYAWQSMFRDAISTFSNTFDYRMLKEISELESLDISGNRYISDLSPLGRLDNLKNLNISRTSVRSLTPIRNLTKLEVLECSGTNITSLEPLKYMINLRELIVDGTSIANLEPAGNFIKLEKLYCDNTPLSDLSAIQTLDNLKVLNCASTLITDLSPISGLVNLRELDFSVTDIKSLEALDSLMGLEVLSFENTPVASLEPLRNLRKLKMIVCNNTGINSLQPLASVSSLERIYCDNTLITKNEANQFKASNPHVLVIYESAQLQQWWVELPAAWKEIFGKFVRVTDSLSVEEIAKITNLDTLNLSGNQAIENLEPLQNLIRLTSLDISNTNISNLEPLAYARNLKQLNISNTQVNALLPLKDLQELELLNCDNTHIESEKIDLFIREHSQCLVIYKSSTLILWWNGLETPWREIFKKTAGIDGIPTREQLHKLIFTESLKVSGDQLRDLSPVKEFIRLKELEFTGTQISDLSPLSGLANLETLVCSRSPIMDLSPLQNLGNLRHLSFENTRVNDLKPIRELTGIETLNCAGTQLTSLKHISDFTNLKVLDCYNTFIKTLNHLKKMDQLTTLRCYNTRVSDTQVEMFKRDHPNCEVVYY